MTHSIELGVSFFLTTEKTSRRKNWKRTKQN